MYVYKYIIIPKMRVIMAVVVILVITVVIFGKKVIMINVCMYLSMYVCMYVCVEVLCNDRKEAQSRIVYDRCFIFSH